MQARGVPGLNGFDMGGGDFILNIMYFVLKMVDLVLRIMV